ncbi:G-alpha-domain-containing protein [Paraphaeosphaeria sporulosa]|uniref:G-alpha-domain-containing protein n=1 Tax=Paraphaeosphaeria sporulosa TaxID=1460663 RepID=A0A177CFN7_9PLEO|nr:G-alpha-domain-containing protein [Paraphaeosphaeria sporulosa]OAG06415.1 G-alpha-domain-containing protein [Paraphaeosphaeria sporulosa]
MRHLQDLIVSAILRILPRDSLSEGLRAKKRTLAIDRALKKDTMYHFPPYNVLPLGDAHAIRDFIEDLKRNDNRANSTKTERLDYRDDIYRFVITCANQLFKAVDERADVRNQVERVDEHHKRLLHQLNHCHSGSDNLDDQIGGAIAALWNVERIKTAFKSHYAVEWVGSASYFFDNILRLTAPNYLPTETDILHARKGFYAGITELHFSLPNMSLNFLDVRLGGERRKWIHQFDDVPVILFIVNLCSYDQLLSGSNTIKSMITLFESVVNRERWRDATFVVFLSGVTEFRRKLGASDFGEYFQDYNELNCEGDEIEKVKRYLVREFEKVNKEGAWVRIAFVDSGGQGNIGAVGDAVKDSMQGVRCK